MGSLEPQLEPWVEELENELKALPKTSILESKSTVYSSTLDQSDREKLKGKLVVQLNFFWTVCHYSSKQKNAFEHICNNLRQDGTDTKILAFYDVEIKNLKQYYENNKKIFDLLDLHKKLIIKLRNTLSESEKTMLAKNASDMETRLKKMDTHYKLLNGKNFYTYGRTITEYIESLTKAN